MVTVQWFLCLYINTLPVETALRVWDIFFSEGEHGNSKVLFRVATALLKLHLAQLLRCQDGAGLYSVLREIGKDFFDADYLISQAYRNYDGGLPMKLVLYKEVYLDSHAENHSKSGSPIPPQSSLDPLDIAGVHFRPLREIVGDIHADRSRLRTVDFLSDGSVGFTENEKDFTFDGWNLFQPPKRDSTFFKSPVVRAKAVAFKGSRSFPEKCSGFEVHLENRRGDRWAIFRQYKDFLKNYQELKEKVPDFQGAGFYFPEHDSVDDPNRLSLEGAGRVNEYIQIMMSLQTQRQEFLDFLEPQSGDMHLPFKSSTSGANTSNFFQSSIFNKDPERSKRRTHSYSDQFVRDILNGPDNIKWNEDASTSNCCNRHSESALSPNSPIGSSSSFTNLKNLGKKTQSMRSTARHPPSQTKED